MKWSVTEVLVDKKSKFQGRAVRIASQEEIPALLSELREDKHIKKSTHPHMNAWRVQNAQGQVVEGSSDCNEGGSGARLLGLLQKIGLVNVLLVVTRWYGGVPLGGARFKDIGTVGLQALKAAGLVQKK